MGKVDWLDWRAIEDGLGQMNETGDAGDARVRSLCSARTRVQLESYGESCQGCGFEIGRSLPTDGCLLSITQFAGSRRHE